MPIAPTKRLETFPNPQPDRDYIIAIETPEFTCLCPKTGQPDFATVALEYVPDRLCVELKALKLYLWSYRNQGAFHEQVTNTILNDLVATTQPRYASLAMRFNVRGGIYTTVTAEYRKPGWQPPPARPEHLPRVVEELPGRETEDASPPQHGAKPKKPPRSASPRPVVNPPPSPATVHKSEPPQPGAAEPTLSNPATAPLSGRFRMLKRTRTPGTPAATDEQAASVPTPPPAVARSVRDVYIGIDIGTSGCRAVAIGADGKLLAHAETQLATPLKHGAEITQDPASWWKALTVCVQQLAGRIDLKRVHRLAIDGTSGTLLLCDRDGTPVTPALMYNDRRAEAQATMIAAVATPDCGAHGASSSLAKLLWLKDTKSHARAAHALHQAEWLANRLTGEYGHGDYNNALRLGYDPQTRTWPDWLTALDVDSTLLPRVHAPGETLGTLAPDVAETLGLPPTIEVTAGTTDGVAAFLATGASRPGHAVTILGSTLVLKLLVLRPVFSVAHGVYSHRLGKYWLAGGASNSGGAVLLQYFDEQQLRELTPMLDPEHSTDLEYYPLPGVGERFPINDAQMEPKLEPLPGDSATFLQGLLEGIARIEARGYQVLVELGAPPVTTVWTIGGGSRNPAWTRIRERTLGIKLETPRSEHPAYGAALLAAGVVARSFQ